MKLKHARIHEFSSGAGGPGKSDKKALATFFFFFFSPRLVLQKSNGQFLRNLSFFKVPEGVQHFPGGPTFSRGSNCLFHIKTHITCDFPGGGGGGGGGRTIISLCTRNWWKNI